MAVVSMIENGKVLIRNIGDPSICRECDAQPNSLGTDLNAPNGCTRSFLDGSAVLTIDNPVVVELVQGRGFPCGVERVLSQVK